MPAYKGTKVLGTLKGGFHPKGTAPAGGSYKVRGAKTTDPNMANKKTMGSFGSDFTNTPSNPHYRDENNTYSRAAIGDTSHNNFYRSARTPGLGN